MRVANRKCIWRLGLRSMRAARARNVVAVAAIALTTVLFTTLFTIISSVLYVFEQENFRQVGSYDHGAFKYVTEEQIAKITSDRGIAAYGLRRYVGNLVGDMFIKNVVEVGYSDANNAEWTFAAPQTGRLPAEGTREAAVDEKVLSLLGVEPKIGTEFAATIQIGNTEVTESFILSGWWEHDEAIATCHFLVSESEAEKLLIEAGEAGNDGISGSYTLDVMFGSSAHITEDMLAVIERCGYQMDNPLDTDTYVNVGINWAYESSQAVGRYDIGNILELVGVLALMFLTGYLIIYNVFQISVAGDIRFYGLLKTIGTTGRQLRRIVTIQAFVLSIAGIPIGLLLGYGVGWLLVPWVLSSFDFAFQEVRSQSILIFVGAIVFSMFTVLVSCRRPGRLASRVSPIEAVRYTEAEEGGRRKEKKGSGNVSLLAMAVANLGRSRKKTAVTILSLSLAVILFNLTVMFAGGFDMDKYVEKQICTDFIFAETGYFTRWHELGNARITEEVLGELKTSAEVTNDGRIYREEEPSYVFVDEAYYRGNYAGVLTEEELAEYTGYAVRNDQGKIAAKNRIYGMEDYALGLLTVLAGDISKLQQSDGSYIAAVYWPADDYGNPDMESHWAQVGDTVQIRYGERDVEYEVAALVMVPTSVSYRYWILGSSDFVLGAQTFLADTGSDTVLCYAFETTEETEADMERFLAGYGVDHPEFDYESRARCEENFYEFQAMFWMVGSALCLIVGLVGILNFINAVLTGILSRRREFAILQAVGMTGGQLRRMLVWEGILQACGAVLLAMVALLPLGPMAGDVMCGMFWFFSYDFTMLPALALLPVFAVLGVALPLVMYRVMARETIVERLREVEA